MTTDTDMDVTSRHVEQTAALREALARGRERMYQENALFHHMVESFARMLPAMVDGMAEHAAREETSLHGTIERLRSGLAAYSTSAVCRNCGEPITYADGIWTHAKDRIPCDWVRFCGDGPWWQQQGSGTMAIDLYPHAKAQP